MEGPRELAPGVFGLGSHPINWYLVEDGGRLTAVDAGLPGFAATLEADLAEIGHRPEDVEAVVLTHSDDDHKGMAGRFREAGARVLIHADDAPALAKPGPKKGDAALRHVLPNLWRPPVLKILAHAMRNGAARPPKIEDAETFADGDVLDVAGRPRVVHTPGHTAGHCAVHFADRGTLLVSDALCAHPLMVGDRGPELMPRYFNEDNAAAMASLERIESLEADVLLFGHGEPWREGPAAAVARARENARR